MRCQQDILYAAERKVVGLSQTIPANQLQRYVDDLRETRWWDRNFANVLRIDAFNRPKGNSSVGSWHSDAGAGVIEVLPCHLTELYVLHEVCHCLAAARFGSHAHDPWFATIYLEAVQTFMGTEAYVALYESFESHGVDHHGVEMVPAGIPLGPICHH